MTKDQLIEAIRTSALTEGEYTEVFQATMEAMLGNALLGMGMDMATGSQTVSTGVMPSAGAWVPAPMCVKFHKPDEEGWRRADRADRDAPHEHWVVS